MTEVGESEQKAPRRRWPVWGRVLLIGGILLVGYILFTTRFGIYSEYGYCSV